MGWDGNGRPTEETLRKLMLENLLLNRMPGFLEELAVSET